MTFMTMLTTMSSGMLRTLAIFFLTLLFSLPLGMLVTLARKSKFAPLRGLIKGYISIMRGTPLMLQLLAWYFGPYYLFGISIRGWRFPAIVLGFSLNYAAYFAEIFRSGIESISRGQYEAAEVLGYNGRQTFFKIILPQVIKIVLPSVTNEIITLIKDTSFAFTLAYADVFSIAKQISASQTSFMPFLIAGVFYYVMNWIIALVMERAEKALSYFR